MSHYLVWHYSGGVRSFLTVWKDFLWFAYNFFSIPLLFRTFLSPFQRLGEEYKRTLDVGAIFSTLVTNIIMRFVGAIARGFVILIGIMSIMFVLVAGVVLFIAWLFLPFLIFSLVILGIYGLVR
jgi:hypothetical protein